MSIELQAVPRAPSAVRAMIVGVVAMMALSACAVGSGAKAPDAGIAFRESRATQIAVMQDFRACRDEALALDGQARKAGSTARYNASARVAADCERALGEGDAALVPPDERMRNVALGVLNRIKGGDLAGAQVALAQYQEAFPDRDLYFRNGASFVETADLLIGGPEATHRIDLTAPNIPEALRAELRRVRYWGRN